ncbi:molybdopterin-dependent oxidoreductase [Sphingobacterium ginsenosidimutans]|uniref:Oxidoreductase molybdopterin-binding domain-containing protein n=1 Tax=Sphingobacterium ginsenosidimutans TaxID=687845 RepID=A0ABP7ZWI4_9SPHI
MEKIGTLLAALLLTTSIYAQQAFKLKVSGEVGTPLELSLQDLTKLPRKNAALTDRDGKVHQYTGVPVYAILQKAGVTLGGELRGANLSKYLLVKCADGYEVLLSLAEIDNSFTDREVILADTIEQQPLEATKGPLRLVVPGEKKPARSCFQVIELVVGYGKD